MGKTTESFASGAELAIIFGPGEIDNVCQVLQQQYRLCPISKIHCVLPSGANVDFGCLDNLELKNVIEVHFFSVESFNSNSIWLCVLQALNYDGRPLAFLQAKSRVTKDWIQRLSVDGLTLDNNSSFSVSAVGLKHDVNSIFDSEIADLGLTVEPVDQWLNEYSDGTPLDTQVLSPAAALLVGIEFPRGFNQFSSDEELFQFVSSQGPMLLSSHVLVDDRQLDQRYLQSPLFLKNKFARSDHPLNSIGHSISELIQRGEEPPRLYAGGPVQLHIAHSWGGGLGRWVQDYIDADTVNRNLVLRPIGTWGAFGQSLALYKSGKMDVPIEKWVLARSIASTDIHHAQYAEILKDITNRYGVEKLIVSSFIGQSLDVLRTALPSIVVLHDYYPFCPALVARFDSPCRHCDSQKQANCKSENSLHKFFENENDQHWELLRPEYVKLVQQDNVQLVAPTNSMKDQFLELINGIEKVAVNVIPHGLPESHLGSLMGLRDCELNEKADEGRRLKVVVLGSLVEIKGLGLFKESMPELLKFCDIYLIGCGDTGREFSGIKGVTVVPTYQAKQLPSLLAQCSPDIGLLMSIVPETFSYTLSELWAAGIPVVATKLGAYSDRIKHHDNGWLVDVSSQSIVAQLKELSGDFDTLASVKQNVISKSPMKSVEMVAAYEKLHSSTTIDFSKRYRLARKTHDNPYLDNHEKTDQAAIYIDRQVPYRLVLLDFLTYSREKIAGTDKLSPWLRRLLSKMHGLLIKLLGH